MGSVPPSLLMFPFRELLLFLYVALSTFLLCADAKPDASYPDVTPTRIAFGSCHKNKFVRPERGVIWDAIGDLNPDAWIWTGDAIYPPVKGTADVDALRREYDQMLHNDTLGYRRFLSRHGRSLPGGVHGTWDDHDYGGNDRGREMPHREERRDAYLDFLSVPDDDARRSRKGLYSSIDFGKGDRKVKVLLIDTRWDRDRHCIPSVGGESFVPLGAVIACVTRWITAGLNLPRYVFRSCQRRRMLSEDQWSWLETELAESDASAHIVVSSVQVLTTNPVVESWGHFIHERERLLRLMRGIPGLVLLSGDVHHAEMLDSFAGVDTPERGILEVTSSGLTHSCEEPFYGRLCKPILNAFSTNRFRGRGNSNVAGVNVNQPEEYLDGDKAFYYTGQNFGTIDYSWGGDSTESSLTVSVHDRQGYVVLTTGPLDISRTLFDSRLDQLAQCTDGHLIPFMKKTLIALFCLIAWLFLTRASTKKEDIVSPRSLTAQAKKRN